MLIAQISDTHITVDLPEASSRLDDLARTVAAINALDPAPDVVLHTGDLANRARAEEYAAAREVIAGLAAPFFPVPGNRDDRRLLRETFLTGPCLAPESGFVQYVVDGFPVRLVGLDTHSGESQQGRFCPERARIAGGALAAGAERPTRRSRFPTIRSPSSTRPGRTWPGWWRPSAAPAT